MESSICNYSVTNFIYNGQVYKHTFRSCMRFVCKRRITNLVRVQILMLYLKILMQTKSTFKKQILHKSKITLWL